MIIILDGNSIAYRAYHKAPHLTAPDGTPTGAVHVFFTILEKVRAQLTPSAVLAVFDARGETERHREYPEYKATRDAMPEDLSVQMETIKSILPLAGVALYTKPGFEADDIIATLALATDEEVVIVTKDKDIFQLINDRIRIYDDNTGMLMGADEAKAKYGVTPEQMVDYLSLMGDKSDNIPGVTGIGEKTAAKLISEYGTIENIYDNIKDFKGKLKENLERDKNNLSTARSLIALRKVSPLFEPITGEDREKLQETLSNLGMRTVASRLLSGSNTSLAQASKHAPKLVRMGEVKEVLFFIAVDDGSYVTDGEHFESFDSERHEVVETAKFYDVKAYYKLTGKMLQGVHDYLLISWLVEPDNGTIRKSRTEPMEEFIPRLIEAAPLMDAHLKRLKLEALYTGLELPIAYILGKCELFGIRIDPDRVKAIARTLRQNISIVATKIMQISGAEINLNSPKQLAELLYDKLGIQQPAKTKRSTAEDVLSELMNTSPEHRELLEDILTYREYSKLLSTYTSPLTDAMGEDGRIHTTYKQTGTATGRLSSVAPNLQNIPARGEIGQTIRNAFIPADGYRFISLDYSQIELRVLAHLSGDPELRDAFIKNEDIHSSTAMKIFHLKKEELTPDSRRLAKAVNFGILYGLSPFGLARDTGVTPKEAKAFIDAYFALYGKVKSYISEVIELTRQNGYCETILGRKRFFPDINSRNGLNRQRAERAAVNAPMQGSAADIIKLAMIKCDTLIRENGFNAHLCLQIHDELVFEVRSDIVDTITPMLVEAMDSAVKLDVPLAVNAGYGDSWGELK